MKKLLSVLLALSMILSLAACGNVAPSGDKTQDTKAEETKAEDGAEETEAASNPDEWPTVIMEVISHTDTQEAEAVVEGALNDYLISINAGVKADLLPLAFGDRATQLTLLLSDPSDAIDLFAWRFYSTVDGLVKNEQAISLEQYKDVYPELWELYPEKIYDTCTVNGELYSMPAADSFGVRSAYVMRKDVAEAIGAMDKVDTTITMDELNEMLEAAREAFPEYCCQTTTDFATVMGIDNLGNTDAIGALMNRGVGATEVVNYYETDEFRQFCELCKYWADNGMIVSDPLTTDKTGLINDRISCGGFVDGYSLPYIYSLLGAQIDPEIPFVLFELDGFVGTNAGVVQGWSISTNSKNPDAAMKLLSLLLTDANVANIVSMGVEGETYQLDENNCAHYVDGKDSSNTGWNCNAPWWYPNQCLTYPFDTDFTAYYTDMMACWFDESSAFSSGMGFVFDNSSVFDQFAACSAVVKEYKDALIYGQVDIDETLPKFIQELKDAGIDEVVAEENAQFQEFLNK